jgi:ubiquinone/menaquinone biosynthesis C-methylase UbiE
MPAHDSRDTYYVQVSQAFDQAARNYDALYQANPIMAWMRRENLATLRDTFAPGSRLLEIGCGTGDEALALSRAGYRIVATDISPAMVQAAHTKARAGGADKVTWLALPAGQLADLAGDYGPGSFDGAYASFGALNCEPDLAPVAAALERLLRAGAALVCSVMNRWCAWEIGWALSHLRPGRAFRRLGRGWIDAGLASPEGRLSVPTRYYSPRGFARLFGPRFRVRQVRGLPVFLPPPYLAHLLDRHSDLFRRLEGIERRLGHRYPFRCLGDHTLLVLVREGD